MRSLLGVSGQFLALVSNYFPAAHLALEHFAGDKTPDSRGYPVRRPDIEATAIRTVAPAVPLDPEGVECAGGDRNLFTRDNPEFELILTQTVAMVDLETGHPFLADRVFRNVKLCAGVFPAVRRPERKRPGGAD